MKKTSKFLRTNGGFSLVELIIVVAIILVLGAIATPAVLGQVEKANIAADETNAKGIADAIMIAIADAEAEGNDISFTTAEQKFVAGADNANGVLQTAQKYYDSGKTLKPKSKEYKGDGFYVSFESKEGNITVTVTNGKTGSDKKTIYPSSR